MSVLLTGRDKYCEISIHRLSVDKRTFRYKTDVAEDENLKQSIAAVGIRVPIIVEQVHPHRYVIIDGVRRYRAAKLLGIKTITAVVKVF